MTDSCGSAAMTGERKMEKAIKFPYNLFLIGFNGDGKSALAACLHRKFHMKLVEMDEKIAEQEGNSEIARF